MKDDRLTPVLFVALCVAVPFAFVLWMGLT